MLYWKDCCFRKDLLDWISLKWQLWYGYMKRQKQNFHGTGRCFLLTNSRRMITLDFVHQHFVSSSGRTTVQELACVTRFELPFKLFQPLLVRSRAVFAYLILKREAHSLNVPFRPTLCWSNLANQICKYPWKAQYWPTRLLLFDVCRRLSEPPQSTPLGLADSVFC